MIDFQEDFNIDPELTACPTCDAPLSARWQIQLHHKFSQTETNTKLYGKLLHDKRNIQVACWNCHPSHISTKLIHWNELDFCKNLDIKPRSKTHGGKIG